MSVAVTHLRDNQEWKQRIPKTFETALKLLSGYLVINM